MTKSFCEICRKITILYEMDGDYWCEECDFFVPYSNTRKELIDNVR